MYRNRDTAAVGGHSPRRPTPRILLLSRRHLDQRVWQGNVYEFEDVIMSVDDVRMVAPHPPSHGRVTRLGRRLAAEARQRLRMMPVPDVAPIAIEGDYDLCVAVLAFARQVNDLRPVKHWRRRSRKAVCVIFEQWLPWVAESREYLELLGEFDHVFVCGRRSIPEMRALSRTSVDYLTPATDVLTSCPLPTAPRVVDVYSIGRSNRNVHDALSRLAREERLTYIFDSLVVGTVPAVDYLQHRLLVRHLLKRSRFFLAFRHNDTPEFVPRTGGEEALAFRYFEAAASGAVILGSAPDCDDFRTNFDWSDAVIRLSPDGSDVDRVLGELDEDPARIGRTRLANISHSLRRHDWVYRWQAILRAVGLSDSSGMRNRLARLDELNGVASASIEPAKPVQSRAKHRVRSGKVSA